jgi:hypothetical protein
MVKVLMIQVDNRLELDYLCLTRKINTRCQEYLYSSPHTNHIQYTYLFFYMMKHYYEKIHPATAKIQIVMDLLNENKYDIIVFLDSDAWIQNPDYLHQLMDKFIATPDIHGCYSRDPFLIKNTYINSGSFLLKVNDYTRNMYRTLLEELKIDPSHHNEWTYDQYYISNYVFQNKPHFWVFKPDVLNTPFGMILRHNWYKNVKMFRDLYQLLDKSFVYTIPAEPFLIENYIDTAEYPNKDDSGYHFNTFND